VTEAEQSSQGEIPKGTTTRFAPLIVMGAVLLFLLMEALGLALSIRLTTLLLGLCAVLFGLGRLGGHDDVLNPARVFGCIWCICLALASMRLLPFLSEWRFPMWSCVLTALFCFVGGFWAVRFRDLRELGKLALTRREDSLISLKLRSAMLAATVCLAIGVATLGYEYHLVGGIPILSENPDASRMALFGFGEGRDPAFNTLFVRLIHPFVEFTKYSVFLAVLVLIRKNSKSKRTWIAFGGIAFLGTAAYCSQGGRTFVVSIVIICLAFVHYLRRPIKQHELAIAMAILCAFVALFGAYRIEQSGSAPQFDKALRLSSFPSGPLGDASAFGYATITSSLEVFNRLRDDLRSLPSSSSGYLFYAFHSVVPRSNLGDVALDMYSGEFVTATFLGEFYADFGYPGVLFGPLLLGVIYGLIYGRGEKEGSIYWIYVRALFLQMLVFFPYVNLFSQYLTWIFDVFFMYFLLRCTTREKDRTVGVPAYVPQGGRA